MLSLPCLCFIYLPALLILVQQNACPLRFEEHILRSFWFRTALEFFSAGGRYDPLPTAVLRLASRGFTMSFPEADWLFTLGILQTNLSSSSQI
ncbi:hypothetical protein DFS33DRAFT_977682 [Desarmillaria ectypa]|nr:hypothetical protein DFS33DRAFT_977682 [Desarmillaria ectypa]